MAVAFGEDELEGFSGVTGAAAAAWSAAAETEWGDAEVFKEVSGHIISLRRAIGVDRIKVEAMPPPPIDFKFTNEFGDVQLRFAGFSSCMPFADCVNVIRGALNADESMTATLTAADTSDGLFLRITVSVAYFLAEYKLPLNRVSVVLSDKLAANMFFVKQQLAAARIELQQSKDALRDATTDGDAAKQQLTEARTKLAAATQLVAELSEEITSLKSQLAEAKAESELRSAELKSAKTTASDSDDIIKELCVANAKVEQQLAKAKAHAAAECRDADDLRAEIGIRDARIRELEIGADVVTTAVKKTDTVATAVTSAVAKTRNLFAFDTRTEDGRTKPSEWEVSADGNSAIAKEIQAQIILSPAIGSDSQVTFELEKKCGLVGVGITEDFSEWLDYGCGFYSDGAVAVDDSDVDSSQAFGGWHSGDRLFVSADLGNGTMRIRAPNGEYTQEWTPSSSPLWFVVFSQFAGTKVRIIS